MKMPERALAALAKYNEAHFGLMKKLAEPEHPYEGKDRRKLGEPLKARFAS